jgi:hypothetical protein
VVRLWRSASVWSTVYSDVVPLGVRVLDAVTVIDVSVPRVFKRDRRCVLLVFVPGSGACHRLDVSSTTPKTGIEIGTSTWSASVRPGVRPSRKGPRRGLHVGNYARFRVSRHSHLSVFSRGVTEIV